MPLVSVLCPTMRVGGLDLIIGGLQQQTFRDFELVISDGIYGSRPDLLMGDYGFPIVHVEPRGNSFPVNAFCKVANEALAAASGEIALFIVDYTWLPPGLLEAHAAFHRSHDRSHGLMGPHQYFDPPALHPAFPRYATDEIDRYCADLAAGTLDPVLFSLFERPARAGDLFAALDTTGYANADPKLAMPAGPIGPSYFHAKNESVAMAAAIAVNGWDEELDGTHCYQDSDFADRLSAQAGISWHLDPTTVAQIVNPRRVFPFPRRLRPVEDNYRIWQAKKAAGYPPVNNWRLK